MSPAVVVSDVAQVPDGWRIARLGDVLRLEYGVPLPERDRLPGDTPVIGSAGVIGFHSQATHAGPAVIVGRKGSIGTVTWVPVDCVPIDTTYCALPVEDKLADLRWIYRVLNREDLAGLNRATGVPGLNRDDVHTLNRLIPPVGEQRAIAAVLDSIDEAIEHSDEVIAATERLRDALLHELLTRGLPGEHSEWKEVPGLGTIPASWKAIHLGDVLKLEYGVSLPERCRQPGNAPVVGSAGIVGLHDHAYLSGPGIVVGRKGSIGTVTWVPEDFTPIDTTYFVLPIEGRANLRWTYYLLDRLDLASLNRATGVPGLNRDDVYALRRPIPPVTEQRIIADVMDSVRVAVEQARDERETLQELQKSVADALLTGRVRVDQRKKVGHGPTRKG